MLWKTEILQLQSISILAFLVAPCDALKMHLPFAFSKCNLTGFLVDLQVQFCVKVHVCDLFISIITSLSFFQVFQK